MLDHKSLNHQSPNNNQYSGKEKSAVPCFKIMVNEARMNSKKKAKQYTGAIKNNTEGFRSTVMTLNAQGLADKLKAGHTIIPAVLEEGKPLRNEHFQSQQLFGLDFDNDADTDSGKVRVEDEYYMTAERITGICNDYGFSPLIIYETFSSKPEHKKFRALFLCEEPITDRDYRRSFLTSLMKLFAVEGEMTTDSSCIDEGRIFYAGHKIVTVNENAMVNPLAVIEAASGIEVRVSAAPALRTKEVYKEKLAPNKLIEAIMLKDAFLYQELLSEEGLKLRNADVDSVSGLSDKTQTINPYVYNRYNSIRDYCLGLIEDASNPVVPTLCEDIFELTSRFPLHIMLGLPLGVRFNCILPGHADVHPSASINKLEDGRYVYNCGGCLGLGRNYDVVETFAKIMGAEFSEVIKFLKTALKIKTESVWQQEQREIIEMKIEYINSEYFKQRYPVLYKELLRAQAFGLLDLYLRFAKEHLTWKSLMDDGKVTFFLSIRHASRLMKELNHKGTSIEAIHRKLTFLCKLGFFDKVKEADIPAEILNKANEVAKRDLHLAPNQDPTYRQDYLQIPQYSGDSFRLAEDYILNCKKTGERRSSATREQAVRTHGVSAADEIYTQDTHKGLSNKVEKFYCKYKEIAEALIAVYGVTSEDEILNKIRGYNKKQKRDLSGQCISQLQNENGYQRIRVNKKTRAEYNIPNRFKSISFVILPK